MRFKGKCLIIVLIVVINVVTVFWFIKFMDQQDEQREQESLFGFPSEMMLRLGDKELLITPNDSTYHQVLELNEWRAGFFSRFDKVDRESMGKMDLYIEYIYHEPISVTLPLEGEDKSVKVSSILFVLTGVDNNVFVVKSGDDMLNLAPLSTSVQLIELVKSCFES